MIACDVLLIGVVLCFAFCYSFVFCCVVAIFILIDVAAAIIHSIDERKERKKHLFHIEKLNPLLDWSVTNKQPFSVHEVLDMWKTCTIAANHNFVVIFIVNSLLLLIIIWISLFSFSIVLKVFKVFKVFSIREKVFKSKDSKWTKNSWMSWCSVWASCFCLHRSRPWETLR